MDFLTNKKTGEAFPIGSAGVSSSEFHNKESDVISTELESVHLKEQEFYADDKRIKTDFDEFEKEYSKVYAPNQTLKRILRENGLNDEAEHLEKIMQMLSHQFHKSKYPHQYDGDKMHKKDSDVITEQELEEGRKLWNEATTGERYALIQKLFTRNRNDFGFYDLRYFSEFTPREQNEIRKFLKEMSENEKVWHRVDSLEEDFLLYGKNGFFKENVKKLPEKYVQEIIPNGIENTSSEHIWKALKDIKEKTMGDQSRSYYHNNEYVREAEKTKFGTNTGEGSPFY